MILKIIFTDECINISKWHSLYVNIFFPSIANLKGTLEIGNVALRVHVSQFGNPNLGLEAKFRLGLKV